MAPKPNRKSGYRPKVAGRTPAAGDRTRIEDTAVENATAEDTTVEVPSVETDSAETDSAETDSAETDSAETESGGADAETVTIEAEAEAEDADAETTEPPTRTRPVSRVSTIRPGDAGGKRAASATTTTRPAEPRRRAQAGVRDDGGWLSRRTIAILAAVAAVFAVFATVAAFHPGARPDNKAFVDGAATSELTAQVRAKLCSAIAYPGPDVDSWAKTAETVLTGEALKNFRDYLPTQRQVLTKTKAIAECRVENVGVRDLSSSGDSATVVAYLIVSQSVNGVAVNSGAPGVLAETTRSGDQWLFSTITPVNQLPQA
ncbi:hypothetical protein QSJ18_04590 [Gordonia sp. ABSL1-1]|uniref:hypothetical protein n=1 Tax=Gordonia sp. ABSL1-1 TaxID=3053923 RepID=UPI0025738FD5|nr:hypothetical protein [Gordonia sp. ABSL1-1]MDL9936013.1 hypothetical protein [Gordonia sp. ABSL1-1]